ncbi:DNA-3-methyladenine glycosylase [Marinoscillum pacificum]|uniref:DNA-3-methyladenine glycosylase n=1 Tax=Marinoscillum pacificum TaxID=392723 RepID=UPI002157B858|nr:DNA-3-methyladenine glycosylase [Marinoscillum pacificum]
MDDLSSYEKLPQSFYLRDDVVQIAKDLLGKYLVTNIGGNTTVGKIVETEAYNGRNDKACHAFHKRTARTEVMYQSGGRAYVYLCYGIHHLFNIVTNQEGLADAVLIRGIEPVVNVDIMKGRRGAKVPYKKLSAGPGTLSHAMGITTSFNNTDLLGEHIWIGRKSNESVGEVVTDVRIGVDYAEEDALLPWRFYLEESDFVSVRKKSDNK